MPRIEVQRDSFMDANVPDTNFGDELYSKVGVTHLGEEKTSWARGIMNFDVSAVAGEVILAATLHHVVKDVWASVAATVYRCSRPSTWTEDGVTWNKYDGVNGWTKVGGDYDENTPTPVGYTTPDSIGWRVVSGLKDFVIDAIDYRDGIVAVIIKLDFEAPEMDSGYTFWSRSVVSHQRPYLEVEVPGGVRKQVMVI